MVSGGGQVRMGGDASDVAADTDTAVSGNGSSKNTLHAQCSFLVLSHLSHSFMFVFSSLRLITVIVISVHLFIGSICGDVCFLLPKKLFLCDRGSHLM